MDHSEKESHKKFLNLVMIGQLHTKNLTIGYGNGPKAKIILENIGFQVNSGELVCLMGPNGIGKSTLIRTLCGLQEPLSGEVLISGNPLNKISESDRSKLVSVVLTERLQGGNLRVRELISMGRYPYLNWLTRLSGDDLQVIDKAIKAIDLSDILNSKLHELSDGQFQRAMIARALIQDGAVMILDEPTAHLDLNNRVEVMRLLRSLAHEYKKAILIATHELDLALQLSDRLILIKPDGSILNGIPEDLVLNGSLDETFLLKGYDLKTGKAEFVPHRKEKVFLDADGHYYLWSKNVLERNGFSVLADPQSADILLKVKGEKDKLECSLEYSDQNRKFDSFQSLLGYLNSI